MENNLMVFQGNNVEVFELNGTVLFNPYDVGECIDLNKDAVRKAITRMGDKQVIKVKNSDVTSSSFRKLNNAGENFITESGVYKMVFKSRKPEAEKFTDWVADEVLPQIRKHGFYETKEYKQKDESISSINDAISILIPMLERAGCNEKIQLLTAKSLYKKSGIDLPIEINAEQQYFDSVQIARNTGMFSKYGNKPANRAVCEIIRKINVNQNEYIDTWESRANWEGTVRKYTQSIVEKVNGWIEDNAFPKRIEYTTKSGDVKSYHVVYRSC